MLDLDLSKVADRASIVPEGTYNIICEEAEVKESKSGGEYIKVKFSITDEEYNNFKVYHMFNIKASNPKAVEIGLQQLKSFMKNAGVQSDKLTNVNILVGRECAAVLKIRKSDEYPDQNVVSYFKEKQKAGPKKVNPSEQFPF